MAPHRSLLGIIPYVNMREPVEFNGNFVIVFQLLVILILEILSMLSLFCSEAVQLRIKYTMYEYDHKFVVVTA